MTAWTKRAGRTLLLLSGSLPAAVRAVLVRRDLHVGDEVADPFRAYDGLSLFRVAACAPAEVRAASEGLASSGCQFLSEPGVLTLPPGGGCAQGFAVCPPGPPGPGAELAANGTAGEHLRRRSSRMLRHRPGASVELRLGDRAFYEAFRPLGDIQERLRALALQSRGAAELLELSPRTHEGRSLRAVRLRGAGWRPGMPRALFTYMLHAREWITAMAGTYAVERLIEDVAANASLLENLEVTFVPISNPDGFVYSAEQARFWRKNRRSNPSSECTGVDLNRNFEFAWSDGLNGDLADSARSAGLACQEVYPGPSPASEPETQALQSLVGEAPLTVSIDFHSFGGYILGPWSYTTRHHPRNYEIHELGRSMQSAIQADGGMQYEFCTGNTCIYPVPGNLADYGSSTGALGFTIEMRPVLHRASSMSHFSPPPEQILPSARESYQAVRAALRFARETIGKDIYRSIY